MPGIAAPSSIAEAAAVLRSAAELGLAIVCQGAGTKQDWGTPPRRTDLVLDTRGMTGIVEHAAGDLIVIVRAGTPVAELNAKLAASGQQLALDVPLPGATVGGTVAVSTSGPRRMAYGTVRDLLIGITVVRPDGTVARAGGKVVKNVAGYDLGKLYAGSYGTLGLIAECVFRLHPVPAASTVLCRRFADPASVGRAVQAILGAQLVPGGIEVNATPADAIELAVRLDGVPEGVRERATVARSLLDSEVTEGVPEWWGVYPWERGDVGIKLTARLSRVPGLLAVVASQHHHAPLTVRGSAGTGVLYAGLPGTTDPGIAATVVERLRAAAHEAGGHAVVLTAPAPIRDRVDMWGPVPGLELMRRVKAQFDPDARFAPGSFVGGL